MTQKTNYEYMVETADFYRVRSEEARKEVELLHAMLDEAKNNDEVKRLKKEVERHEEENNRLRAALNEIEQHLRIIPNLDVGIPKIGIRMWEITRAALGEDK